MAINRNAILDKIVADIRAIPTVKTVIRRRRDLNFNEMPAVLIVPDTYAAETQPNLPALWKLSVKALVYVHDTSSTGPSVPLHAVLDQIEAAFEPKGYAEANTLGGLVIDCRISGTTLIDDQLGDVAVAEVPIEVTAA